MMGLQLTKDKGEHIVASTGKSSVSCFLFPSRERLAVVSLVQLSADFVVKSL